MRQQPQNNFSGLTTVNHPWPILLVLCLTACTWDQKGPPIEQGSKTIGAIGNVVNLDQQWTVESQQLFYSTTQGSRILPYAWYLALEQKGSLTLFRDNANMAALRYLPSSKTRWNPDGLAVGFAKDTAADKKEWMGLTCAACHTTQIDYKNVSMRIDGGPTMGDFENFNVDLVAALDETYSSDAKFKRFATAVLGSGHSSNQATILRTDLIQRTLELTARNNINHSGKDQPHYGYGRLDAIGAIFNQILASFNDLPNNGLISDAPASYPFLWGTHQSDVVQWTGFAPNGPLSLGALIRNGGEVLGVYGQLKIPEDPKIIHYESSLSIRNLGRLEAWVAELRSPIWPAEILPKIDLNLAAAGKLHYAEYCASCHQVMGREQQGQNYKAVLTPLSELGTDPQEIINMAKTRPAGKFEGRKEAVIAGDAIPAQTTGLYPLVNSVVGALLQHPVKTIEAAVIEYEGGRAAAKAADGMKSSEADGWTTPQHLKDRIDEHLALYENQDVSTSSTSGEVYKARPLTGIWATAPYLHNGSVLNIAQLLLPADQRLVTFYQGSREFDPINVGFVSTADISDAAVFEFDTRLTGNANSGHEYGAEELNDAEKKALLEYIKTL